MRTCCASVAGPGNRARGMAKQDAAMVRRLASGVLLVVCDGLGSRFQSANGARQACCAVRAVFAASAPPCDNVLCESVHRHWVERVTAESAEAAATTCLFSYVEAGGNATVGQLGDGMILCRSRGRFTNLTPERSGFSNQTLALSGDFTAGEWLVHRCVLAEPGDGIVIMTDGISEDIDHGRLEEFFEDVRNETFSRRSRAMGRWLTHQLHEWPTLGHSDDKSIAAVFWEN